MINTPAAIHIDRTPNVLVEILPNKAPNEKDKIMTKNSFNFVLASLLWFIKAEYAAWDAILKLPVVIVEL